MFGKRKQDSNENVEGENTTPLKENVSEQNEESPFKFKLDDKVQDTITSFQGIVVARVEWYNGCVRYLVQPQELKDQVPIDPQWFDEAQVKIVEQTQREETQEKPGGPNRGEPKSPVS